MSGTGNPITRFYQACEPNESLNPTDERYVNCDEVRGENLVDVYARGIRRAACEKPEIKLFAGHRGVGKSSELLRLKRELEQPSGGHHKPFKVIYFDVGRSLDPNDLEFPDLLVFTAAEVQRQLRASDIPGFSATSTYFSRVWDDIKTTLGAEVTISGADIEVGYASLALEIRNRPSARSILRTAIEAQSTNLFAAVNDLLQRATSALVADGRGGLVLIIDGLDKIVLRPLDDGKSNTHIRLFCDRAEQLVNLRCHTVYTVPISLIYSAKCAQLEQCFGEFNVPMPMIRLRGQDKSEVMNDSLGMRTMWKMIEARCKYAKVDIRQVFDQPETGAYLCKMSGGHPRHLMMFLQAAANVVDDFPLTKVAAERAVRNYANSLLREVPDVFWTKLRNFVAPQDEIPKDDDHQLMLFLLHVFEYMNCRPWYEVNPVLRTLPKFNGD